MHPAVSEYIAKKKKDLEAQRNALLMQEGLYEKEYGDYNIADQSFGSDKTGTFKKIPLEVTDEEYEEIKKYATVASKSGNSIAKALKIIAILDFIGGFVFGLFLADNSDLFGFLLGCGIGLISGFMMLGFSEVIKLLQRIADK